MPKKKPALVQKASNLLNFFIFMAKTKKRITRKLLFLRKTRKLKRFKLLKPHSQHGYVKEYEFSPSNTPLIQFRRHPPSGRISFGKLCSDVVSISKCLGMMRSGEEGEEIYCLETGSEPWACKFEDAVGRELEIDLWNSCSEEETVDERAERFIQRFYEDMRRQRQELNYQRNAVLAIDA